MFMHTQRYDFSHRVFNGKLNAFIVAADEKIIDFDPSIKTLIVQKLQKVLLVLIYLDVHIHFSR